MAVTGKTGADAIYIALHHICLVITRYNLRLINVIAAAESGGAITAQQATDLTTFINTASVACAAFGALANFSGF